MNICDMHCDTLTACADCGADLLSNGMQADFMRLKAAGVSAQCFAIFTRDCGEEKFYSYAAYFYSQTEKYSDIAAPVRNMRELVKAERENKLGCILTAENLAFLRSEDGVDRLYAAGVRMASLVWNDANALAFPNLRYKEGAPDFALREARGLTRFGRKIAERLDEKGIIIDISHLSDGGAAELLKGRKKPLVASHSNAYALCPVSRNLDDGQIKAVADCGGIIGVNYCLEFLGSRDALEGALAHIKYIVSKGGEDCAALGGDLDGMAVQRGMESCSKVANLAQRLSDSLGQRATEKICSGNFLRVFKDIAG